MIVIRDRWIFYYPNFTVQAINPPNHTASDIGELEVPEQRVKAVADTPSPRLDNVVSAAFWAFSRSEAVRAISKTVFVNHEEVTKIDKRV